MEHMQKLPPLVRISMIMSLFRFVIPKMHIHAHTLDCQVKFSLNLVPGSGQTDREGIERPWASIGAIASSTRVSGPGAQHNALDDHWSFWNWLKTIGLREFGFFFGFMHGSHSPQAIAALLRRRLDNARKEAASQRAAFEAFSLEQIERVPVWKKMIDNFEKDHQAEPV
jgi:hypothetical protein